MQTTVVAAAVQQAGSPHRLQLPEQGVLGRSLLGGLGDVEVQPVAVPQGVQTQHKRNVVLQQAGVWVHREPGR